jgi:hypothetical protein
MFKKDLPSILYKYRFFDQEDHHISIIEEQNLWFASARTFSDPYDSTLSFDLSDNPPGIIKKWANDFAKRNSPSMSRKERRKLVLEKLKKIKDNEHTEWFSKHFIESNLDKFGICSLTSKYDNLLMWALYADGHKGYCVGLDVEVIKNKIIGLADNENTVLDIHKIDYFPQIPKINFFESMLSVHSDDDIIKLLSTKSDEWQYEDEYRLTLWEHVNQVLNLPREMIKSVYLGCNISDKNQERILSILDFQKMNANVYRSKICKDNFKLDFNHIR